MRGFRSAGGDVRRLPVAFHRKYAAALLTRVVIIVVVVGVPLVPVG